MPDPMAAVVAGTLGYDTALGFSLLPGQEPDIATFWQGVAGLFNSAAKLSALIAARRDTGEMAATCDAVEINLLAVRAAVASLAGDWGRAGELADLAARSAGEWLGRAAPEGGSSPRPGREDTGRDEV